MSENDNPKQSQMQENHMKFKAQCFVEKSNAPHRKTTTKFSTMVPKLKSSHIEIAQDESQMFDLSNDEDFISTSSHSSLGSNESGNSIFLSANGCQAHEDIAKMENENEISTTDKNMETNSSIKL